MAYKVILLSSAEDDFANLPNAIRKRIADALRELTEYPAVRSGIKKLRSPFEGYRKRVGDFRILFDIGEGTISIHRIKNRKDAYK